MAGHTRAVSGWVVSWLVVLQGASLGSWTRADVSAAQTPPSGSAEAAFSPDLPDVSVYDQDGRRLKFRSELIAGRTVAVNFIFTTCRTVCPPLTIAMRAIQRELAGRVGRDIWLISVSVDPAVDRPERLRTFAESFGAGAGWTFVTGDKTEIDRLLKAFGSYGADIGAHSTTMLIGNTQTGRWVRTNGLAPVATNVKLLVEAARTPRDTAGF
jgi:protein SCO1/2